MKSSPNHSRPCALPDETPSVRAAAIEAGIIIPFPSLQLKDPAPTAQKLLAKKGKEWCLQLLDELSALVFED